jgi:hypothetical protein
LQLIVEGSARGLWSFHDKGFQSRIIEDYELSYLAVAQANAAPNKDGGQTKAAAPKDNAPPPAKTADAAVKPAAANGWQPKAVQQAVLMSATPGQQAIPQAPAAGQQPQQARVVVTDLKQSYVRQVLQNC